MPLNSFRIQSCLILEGHLQQIGITEDVCVSVACFSRSAINAAALRVTLLNIFYLLPNLFLTWFLFCTLHNRQMLHLIFYLRYGKITHSLLSRT